MAKPVTLPIWATDTNLSSGTESGSSVKSEPALGVKQQGFVPGRAAPARYYNWLLNLIYTWIVYLDGLASDAQWLSTLWIWTNRHIWSGSFGPGLLDSASCEVNYVNGSGGASTRTRTILIDVAALQASGDQSGVGADVYASVIARFQTSTDPALARIGGGFGTTVRGVVDLSPHLVSGCTLTRVRARVAAEGTSDVGLDLHESTPSFSGSGSGVLTALDSEAALATAATLDSGAISVVVDKATKTYHVSISNSGATGSDSVVVLGLEITISDPGPRNY